MERKAYSRRKFVGKCLGIGTSLFGGFLMISSCNTPPGKEDKKTSSSGDCDDLSGISKEEIEKRERVGYVNESTVPGSDCGNCALHIPPDSNATCGGCVLFKGPVKETGYCTQYVAKS